MNSIHEICLQVKKYKGKALKSFPVIHLNLVHLIGDCSSVSVGGVSIYGKEDVSNEVLCKLMSYYLLTQRWFVHREKHKSFHNKFIFSNDSTYFDPARTTCHYSLFYNCMKSIALKEDVMKVKGWTGRNFEFRCLSQPKNYHHQTLADINWEDFDCVELHENGKKMDKNLMNAQSLEKKYKEW